MIRLTTLGRSNLGCTGSNLLSKRLHASLSRSGKKTMERVLVQDSRRSVQPWASRELQVSDKGQKPTLMWSVATSAKCQHPTFESVATGLCKCLEVPDDGHGVKFIPCIIEQ